MSRNICPSCSAALDWGEHCDCQVGETHENAAACAKKQTLCHLDKRTENLNGEIHNHIISQSEQGMPIMKYIDKHPPKLRELDWRGRDQYLQELYENNLEIPDYGNPRD